MINDRAWTDLYFIKQLDKHGLLYPNANQIQSEAWTGKKLFGL